MRYWKAGMLMDVVGHKGTPVEMPPDRVEVRDGSNRTADDSRRKCGAQFAAVMPFYPSTIAWMSDLPLPTNSDTRVPPMSPMIPCCRSRTPSR